MAARCVFSESKLRRAFQRLDRHNLLRKHDYPEMKAQWAQDRAAWEALRAQLADRQRELERERQGHEAAQARATASGASLAAYEAVFSKWGIPRPPLPVSGC